MFACGKFYSGCGSVLTKDQHNDKETFETTDLQTKYTIGKASISLGCDNFATSWRQRSAT